MPPRLRPIERPNLLMVEGEEEERFWNALLRVRARNDIQVQAVGGKYSLTTNLPSATRARGFAQVRRLGVAQDADDDAGAAFDRICGALVIAGLSVPRRSWAIAAGSPEVVALVLPDGHNPGDLESLVWESVAGEAAVSCVESFMTCLVEANIPLPRQQSKARVHAYLATLDPPDRRLGDAAADSLLLLNSPVFDRILEFFPPFTPEPT
ncbi:MAG: DUF3226 domain-containing protein [Thermomicrobiales bacterium]